MRRETRKKSHHYICCLICGKSFRIYPYELKTNFRKTCSMKCFGKWTTQRLKEKHPLRGRHHSENNLRWEVCPLNYWHPRMEFLLFQTSTSSLLDVVLKNWINCFQNLFPNPEFDDIVYTQDRIHPIKNHPLK